MIEIEPWTKHVDAAMAGFSDAGSTPAVSTATALSFVAGLFLYIAGELDLDIYKRPFTKN